MDERWIGNQKNFSNIQSCIFFLDIQPAVEAHVCDQELGSRSRRIRRTRPDQSTLQVWRPVRATEYSVSNKKCNVRQSTVVQACGPGTLEAESRTSLKVGYQPSLSVEFNQHQPVFHTGRSCLKPEFTSESVQQAKALSLRPSLRLEISSRNHKVEGEKQPCKLSSDCHRLDRHAMTRAPRPHT